MLCSSLAAVFFVTSCASWQVGSSDILFSFTYEDTHQYDSAVMRFPEASVDVGSGTVYVRGEAFDPCYGWDLVASGSRTADTLVLHIDWPEADICMDMTRNFVYEATLSPLEPGEYPVRVRQRVLAGDGWTYRFATVLDTTVQVLERGGTTRFRRSRTAAHSDRRFR